MDSWVVLTTQIAMHSNSMGSPRVVLDPDPISLITNTPGMHLEHGSQTHTEMTDFNTTTNFQR